MTKVIMHGCNGKMGQMITGIIAEDKDVEIVAGIDVSDHIKNTYPVFKSITDCDVAADVIRPSAEECFRNPRAKSTKLRWAVRA